MSKILEELKNIITRSKLPATDQNDLLIFLPILPEKALEDLVNIFKKSPKILAAFNEDFKAKLEALIDGRDAFQKMLRKEKDLLNVWEEEFGKQEKEIDYGLEEIEEEEEG